MKNLKFLDISDEAMIYLAEVDAINAAASLNTWSSPPIIVVQYQYIFFFKLRQIKFAIGDNYVHIL